MRSRPTIEVFIVPQVPVPGAPLLVRVKLTSRSETPIEGVIMRLTGVERRYSHSTSSGNSTSRVYKTHSHVGLGATIPKQKLGVGVYQYEATFDLPSGLPPTYSDELGEIRYRLEIHVPIPWWPDRRESYDLRIPAPAWRAPAAGPQVFATHRDGPREKQLYIEATLDPGSAYIGGTLQGAISLTNVTKKLKHVKVGLVAVNQATFRSSTASSHVRRYEATLFEGGTADGASKPFAITLPAQEWPSFKAALFHHVWALELKAVRSWESDVELTIPLMVAPLAAQEASAGRLQRLPPVGRERRAKVWAHVASQLGLQNDAASEVMGTTVGDVGVRIELEQRDEKGLGLCSVATLSWKSAGIDLQLSERRWTDRLRRGTHPTGEAAFDERFSLRAREAPQAAALVSGPMLRRLLEVTDVVIEDDGAILASPGGGHRLDKLERFVTLVLSIADDIHRALPRVPPPAAASALAARWEAYAASSDGHFERGSLSIRSMKWEGVLLDVVTEWDDGGRFERSVVQHHLDETAPLDDLAARNALADAKAKAGIELVDGKLLVKSTKTLAPTPDELGPIFADVARIARALRPHGPRGPYR